MSKQYNKLIGKLGEDLAAKYLQDQGYQILARNWGSKWGEIDIVCRPKLELFSVAKNTPVVFVEVKTKVGCDFGRPEEMVNCQKLRQIQRLAGLCPFGKNLPQRLDVIAVVLSHFRELVSLNHYQAVY